MQYSQGLILVIVKIIILRNAIHHGWTVRKLDSRTYLLKRDDDSVRNKSIDNILLDLFPHDNNIE
jgi:hypothetical protein